MAHILIVDDSPQDIETIKNILEAQGHQTSAAENGEQAIQKAKELQPDLILMDTIMPGLDGFKTTRKIAKNPETKYIPIVLVSSKSLESDRAWRLTSGGKEYLIKPVKADELVKMVNKILG
jgi:twitching motility two-component system response regulator PilH